MEISDVEFISIQKVNEAYDRLSGWSKVSILHWHSSSQITVTRDSLGRLLKKALNTSRTVNWQESLIYDHKIHL
jgi:hypothetical protein